MRPRVFPAEDLIRPRRVPRSACGFNEAAGIPRGRQPGCVAHLRTILGFNEAAGIPRGRRLAPVPARGTRDASMRPRVFPAEDLRQSRKVERQIKLQ